MELFRVTRSEYQNDLTGIGAFHHGGRWNSPRNYMLYTSSHRSLAMLEVLVHWNKTTPPPDYVVVVLYVPDSMATMQTPYMISDWQEEQNWTKEAGDNWLQEGHSLLCRVPSVVVKSEHNYLVNPLHLNAGSIKVVGVEPFVFDKRLFVLSK
ncbi:RES family NAD+ phosphorylase [Dyadobacter sp. CY323]|uniref:RES family NAD+ phosphorylase n=1 Tax=Dyadobacter sp. CY323 TaxID=2907302 RepID=UPI001F21D62F|nr:RES family NAD+ phosphorylase [Dyadobacter sp. CY323]MCE6989966.1 RES family NAD+ phosphorylase [Dyadobacter sp. CY323]